MLNTENRLDPNVPELFSESNFLLFKCEGVLYSVSARQAKHIALHNALVGQFVKTVWAGDNVLQYAANNHDLGKLLIPERVYFAPKLIRDAVDYNFHDHELDTLRFLGSPFAMTYPHEAFTMGTHHQMDLKPKIRFWLYMALGPVLLNDIERDPKSRIRSAYLFFGDNYIAGTEFDRPDRELPKDKDLLIEQTVTAISKQFPHGLPRELRKFDHGMAYDIALNIAQVAYNNKSRFQPILPQPLMTSLFYPGPNGFVKSPTPEYSLMLQAALA
jgi:hypothetical protein